MNLIKLRAYSRLGKTACVENVGSGMKLSMHVRATNENFDKVIRSA